MLPQAEASRKCDRMALRMHGHSALPNMLTRSRSAATRGSRLTQGLTGSQQADAPLVHVQSLGAEFDLGADSRAAGRKPNAAVLPS